MRRFLFSFLALIAASAAVVAQDATLREGDQVEIRLGGVPIEDIQQVSGSYQVDGQGYINLPNIGKIRASGQTQSGLQQAIENAYRSQQIYTHPTITVGVAATARFVNVGGAVKTPRRVEFTADLTVLGAINAAGGFTEYADQSKVRLMRAGSATLVNIREVRKDPSLDPVLRPGDQIEVPQGFW